MDDVSPLALVVVRQTSSVTRAGDWEVVLAAAGIAYQILRTDDGGWAIAVAGTDRIVAQAALDSYDADSAAPVEAELPDRHPSRLGLVVALALAGFYAFTGPWEAVPPSRWFAVGTASSQLILKGQWWRAVTALTLHMDLLHLISNCLASLLFVTAVGRWMGSGVAAFLIVLAAAGGNLVTAVYRGPGHQSVGASTATFAALGVLTGLQLVRRWQFGPLKRRAWLPLGAGLGLIAMLGAGGPQVDLAAHLFGLGCGSLVGLAVGALGVGYRGPLVQVGAGVAAAAAVVASWLLAFGR